MMHDDERALTGVVLDERTEYTLVELCHACDVAGETVLAMIEEGIIEPLDAAAPRWRFPASAVARLQVGLRLQADLGVNLAGAALAMDLLDELARLRARLGVLETSLRGQRS